MPSKRLNAKSRVLGDPRDLFLGTRAFQKGGGRLPSEQVLALYIAEGDVCGRAAAVRKGASVEAEDPRSKLLRAGKCSSCT